MTAVVTTTQSLQLVLGGAVATTQLPFVAIYRNEYTNGLETLTNAHGTSNGATPVTFIAAPTGAGEKRTLVRSSVVNSDTANATVTLRLNDNATTRDIIVFTLSPTESLQYEEGRGFYII